MTLGDRGVDWVAMYAYYFDRNWTGFDRTRLPKSFEDITKPSSPNMFRREG